MNESLTCEWHGPWLVICEVLFPSGAIRLKADYIGKLGRSTLEQRYFGYSRREATRVFLAELQTLGTPAE